MSYSESKPSQAQPNTIDIDELAKEKVSEIENLLDNGQQHNIEAINDWLGILKQIITAADLHRTNNEQSKNDPNSPEHIKNGLSKVSNNQTTNDNGESIYADYGDDNEQFNAVDLTEQFASNSVKWTIRVRAFRLVHRLIHLSFHRSNQSIKPLIKQLPDLIRLSFVAATSPYDDLKLQGFEMFKYLIIKFSSVGEKEFPGHSILEQYKNQVLSALKPAFDLDAPPYITAIASQVCCLWLCKNLEKDRLGIKKTHQLMLTTIDKLENQSMNQNSKLYTESELEQERLDILSSWAQLYIASKDLVQQQKEVLPNCLEELVETQIDCLISKWWEALKDYALLIMPNSRTAAVSTPQQHNSNDNNHEQIYTREVALSLFETTWYKLVLATTIWLCDNKSFKKSNADIDNQVQQNHSDSSSGAAGDLNEELSMPSKVGQDIKIEDCDKIKTRRKYFRFICGIIMRELCKYVNDCARLKSLSHLPESTFYSLRSLNILVSNETFNEIISGQLVIAQEFYTILYKILIDNAKFKFNCNSLIKNTLDTIFKLTFTIMTKEADIVSYSTAKLIETINNNLQRLNDNSKSDNDLAYIEEQRLSISVEISNLISIMRLKFTNSFQHEDIKRVLMETLGSILTLKKDHFATSISLLESMKSSYQIIPQKCATPLTEALFESKLTVITSTLESVLKNLHITTEEVKPATGDDRDMKYIEIYIKYSQLDVENVTREIRPIMISNYIKSVLVQLLKCEHQPEQTNVDQKRSLDIWEMVFQSLYDLKHKYEEDFEKALRISDGNKTIRAIFDSASKMHENLKSEMEEKNNQILKIKSALQRNASKSNVKAPAKIVLKADFSNFYIKKPQ